MDPLDDLETLGGTTGEPAREADGSQSGSDDQNGTEPPKWKAHLDALAGLSPEELQSAIKDLPTPLRAELEKPFLSNATRKDQEREREYRAQLERVQGQMDGVMRTIEAKLGREATPDERTAIMQRINEGDTTALPEFVDRTLADRLAPIEQQFATQNAVNAALQMVPFAGELMPSIVKDLQGDPALMRMFQQNKAENGQFVLAGLAWKKKAEALMAEKETVAKNAVETYKAEQKKRLAQIPANTSLAASTPTRIPSDGDVIEWDEIVTNALKEQGLTPPPGLRFARK